MRWLFLFLPMLILLGWPASPQAQQPAQNVVGVRDNFIVASIAAKQCNTVDRSKEAIYDRNFTLIARKALEDMTSRAPDVPQEELRKRDLAHIEKLQDAAFNLLRNEGCKSEKVKALLRLHKMHETVRF